MFWNRYFLPSFLILVIIAILHFLGVYSLTSFYWTFSWYDILLHFLGGVWVVLFGLWLLHMSFTRRFLPYASFLNLVLITLAVGVAWEIFELVMGFTSLEMVDYVSDTILDLIMDTIGAVVAVKIFKK